MSNSISTFIGISTAGIFLALALLHVYWALGSQGNSASVIPAQNGKPLFSPTPAITLLVALALLVCALLALGALGFWRLGLPVWLFKLGIWGVATGFFLRAIGDFRFLGFFKTVRNTTFARNDTWFFSPLCVWLAACCMILGGLAA